MMMYGIHGNWSTPCRVKVQERASVDYEERVRYNGIYGRKLCVKFRYFPSVWT